DEMSYVVKQPLYKRFSLDRQYDEMSYVVKQPLYKRFSLDRQCPMTSSSYHGPPSFNYRPLVSSSKPFMPESPTVKQNFYITYSKPSTPVFNQ
ncbi:unnamed protein product, partial [Rotaria magnacalcarata]